ncbi:MAG: S41 family peptidase [Candidatus Harrisonbacteria bacterium]|nr:S41 family peptidase [Candidatus Harrisonbacteria bacterium]
MMNMETEKMIPEGKEFLLAAPKQKTAFGFKFIWILLGIGLVIASGVNGYFIGRMSPKTVIVKGVDNLQGAEIRNADFNTFWLTWDLINKDYLLVDKISNEKMVQGSALGLVDALSDPYSVFFPPEESKRFADDIKGEFGGIGAEIGVKGNFTVVIAPLKDSPAERAGLKPGDKILAINGSSTTNMALEKTVKMIRGEIGTKVILTLLQGNDEKSKEVTIVREEIKLPSVAYTKKDGGIAHIQLFNFNQNSGQLFVDKINEALRDGARGIVLDIRNNPGGYLEVSVDIAGIFIERGKIVVYEEGRNGRKQEFLAHGNAELKDFPIVVLLNKGSASASEILAGALRDQKGTPIIGETSFGKGTIQELKNLPDGSSVKLTIAHWVMPKGFVIDGNGIKPDYEVKLSEEDFKNKKDTQYLKAEEILRSLIK